jgi:hypothetical protein
MYNTRMESNKIATTAKTKITPMTMKMNKKKLEGKTPVIKKEHLDLLMSKSKINVIRKN